MPELLMTQARPFPAADLFHSHHWQFINVFLKLALTNPSAWMRSGHQKTAKRILTERVEMKEISEEYEAEDSCLLKGR
ncbi:hypothetical protein AAFF_G00089520 [Aldrovandia affinis]|uniref:Uncharacterized protein n=1 Tax=Aldrovandia affinis TaxID=143900 RepID=A0AAD7RW76_9TELE|nr:hypothetical protein AAFF_G00089520 [Aldrovandia affinis]